MTTNHHEAGVLRRLRITYFDLFVKKFFKMRKVQFWSILRFKLQFWSPPLSIQFWTIFASKCKSGKQT